MKFRKLIWIVLLVVLALTLAACGGDDDDSGDNGNGGGGDEISLSQSVTASMEGAGEYTLKYPDGWVSMSEEGSIMVANSQEVLDAVNAGAGGPDPEPGQVAVTAMAMPTEALFMFGVEDGATMAEAVVSFSSAFIGEEGTTAELSEAEEFDGGALVAGTVTEGENTYGTIMVAAEVEDGLGIIIVITHPDDVDGLKDTAKAMAAEFEFTAEAMDG